MPQNKHQEEEIGTPLTAPLSSALSCNISAERQYDTMALKGPPSSIYPNQSLKLYRSRKGAQRVRRSRWFVLGIFLVGASFFAVLFLHHCRHYVYHRCRNRQPHDGFQKLILCRGSSQIQSLVNKSVQMHRQARQIMDYLELFWVADALVNHTHSYPSSELSLPGNNLGRIHDRRLSGSGSDSSSAASHYPQLVVAGKMTVEDGPCNIAQYNLKTKEWSLTERIQLSLYNSYSGGEVYSLLANHTFLPVGDSEDVDDDTVKRYVSRHRP